jgi:hypothetical protein
MLKATPFKTFDLYNIQAHLLKRRSVFGQAERLVWRV